jgi:hypothetical protein
VTKSRLLAWIVVLAAGFSGSAQSAEAQLLSDFRPSAIPRGPHGSVSSVQFSSDLIVLESGSLAFHAPQAVKILQFPEAVWVVGYKAEILDDEGNKPLENHLCHTFLGDQRVMQHEDREMRAVYSDAFTDEIHFPEGFGIRFGPEDKLKWMPLFNNRGERLVRVRMRCEIDLIREKDIKQPLRRLYSTLRSVRVPHLFFVPPGRHESQATFQLPFNGTIHFIGTHIHPHGEAIELYNVSRQESVWQGHRKNDPEGRTIGMEVYSSQEGYAVRAGDSFNVKSIYVNPTRQEIDAMAGAFIFYSRD